MARYNKKLATIAPAISSHKGLRALLLVAGFGSLLFTSAIFTGCVESSSEIEVLAPGAVECEFGKDGSYSLKGASGEVSLWTGFNVAVGTNQILGTFEDSSTTPPSPTDVTNPPGLISMGMYIANVLQKTPNYTKLGAGSELRIDQNTFQARKVIFTVINSGELDGDFKIAPKEVSRDVSSGATGVLVVPFLNQAYPDDQELLSQVGTTQVTMVIGIQIEGTLRGGQKLKSSMLKLPITFNARPQTTRLSLIHI